MEDKGRRIEQGKNDTTLSPSLVAVSSDLSIVCSSAGLS